MADFKTDWDRHYAGYNPVGYMMRWDDAPHWIRFHSLPHGKRYATTESEYQIILARHHQVAIEILGAGRPCWVVQAVSEFAIDDEDLLQHTDEPGRPLLQPPHFAYRFLDRDDPPILWDVYAKMTQWDKGVFDPLIRAIADDRALRTLWMSADGMVYAPYDGGADLFLASRDTVDRFAANYADWIPAEGL